MKRGNRLIGNPMIILVLVVSLDLHGREERNVGKAIKRMELWILWQPIPQLLSHTRQTMKVSHRRDRCWNPQWCTGMKG